MEFYRYEDMRTWGETLVYERVFYLVSETPKGYWIHSRPNFKKGDLYFYPHDKPYWVSKTARKRFAYPTREQALQGYLARKQRQIVILEDKLEIAKEAIIIAERKFGCGERLQTI